MVILNIQLKRITNCSRVAIVLPTDPSLTLGKESLGQNSTFSEHGHAAYQIKGTQQMQQHGSKYFGRRPLPDLFWGSKGQNSTFSDHGHVAYESKGNHHRQQHSTKYFARRPLLDPGDGVKRSKFNFFQNIVMLHINLKRNHQMQ